MKKRFFIDTEFIEDGSTIDLVSIGVVCEDGREFYAQNVDCRFDLASDWVKANVYPHLAGFEFIEDGYGGFSFNYDHEVGPYRNHPTEPAVAVADIILHPPWMDREDIRDALVRFVGDCEPEWWGYYSAYDHVALSQLFGRMIDLPKGWPFLTRDIKQLAEDWGLDGDFYQLVPQVGTAHNALDDARWTKAVWERLREMRGAGRTKEGLAITLNKIREDFGHDPESAHGAADDALLDYIGDEKVAEAFKSIQMWYA